MKSSLVVTAVLLLSTVLVVPALGIALAAGAGMPSGGGGTSAQSPPAQHKSHAKKKAPGNRSSLDDFITGYKAAYALIYEQGDYEAAITALRALEILFRFRRVRLRRLQCDVPGNAIDISQVPSFLSCFDRAHRFVDTAPSVVELAELRIGLGQM
jgi:hypothetical protein